MSFVAVVRVQQLEYQLRAQQANNTTLNTTIATRKTDNTTVKSDSITMTKTIATRKADNATL